MLSLSPDCLDLIKRNVDLKKVTVNHKSVKLKAEKEYWKFVFGIVSLPFFCMAFPVHLVFWNRRQSTKSVKQSKFLGWFQDIIYPKNLIILVLTFVYAVNTTLITSYPARAFWNIFNDLVIRGVIEWRLIDNFAVVIKTIPALVPLWALWLVGYSFRDFITSCEFFRRESLRRLILIPRGKATFKHPCTRIGLWVRLGCIYLIILGIHIIPIISDGWMAQHWTKTWIALMYRLIPPVYCICCWIIQSEFQILTGYLTAKLRTEQPNPISPEVLQDVVYLYKRAVTHLTYVNKKIGKYVSFMVIPLLTWPAMANNFVTVLYFRGLITRLQFFYILTIIGEMNMEEMLSLGDSDFLRSVISHIFVSLLEIALVLYMVRQAIHASDESRFAHVLINSMIGDKTRPAILNEGFYKSVRHLKHYMHTTHKEDNPALMMLGPLWWCPFLHFRLNTSKLQNPPIHRRFLNEIV